jgi:hypothetical protein
MRLVAPVDVERVDIALDDRLLVRIRDRMAEAVREKAGADAEDEVAVDEALVGERAAGANRESSVACA